MLWRYSSPSAINLTQLLLPVQLRKQHRRRAHLHVVAFPFGDKYTFNMLCNCLLFHPIRLTRLKDAEDGKQEVHSVVCLLSLWCHSEDGWHERCSLTPCSHGLLPVLILLHNLFSHRHNKLQLIPDLSTSGSTWRIRCCDNLEFEFF